MLPTRPEEPLNLSLWPYPGLAPRALYHFAMLDCLSDKDEGYNPGLVPCDFSCHLTNLLAHPHRFNFRQDVEVRDQIRPKRLDRESSRHQYQCMGASQAR